METTLQQAQEQARLSAAAGMSEYRTSYATLSIAYSLIRLIELLEADVMNHSA